MSGDEALAPGRLAGLTPDALADLLLNEASLQASTLSDAWDKVKNGLDQAVKTVKGWYDSLVAQLNSWLNQAWQWIQSFWDNNVKPWIDAVIKLWDQVVEVVTSAAKTLANVVTDIQLLFDIHSDLVQWTTVQRRAQAWSGEVEAFHIDHGFEFEGKASSRDWIGAAADSYASVWPYQVKAGNRLTQIAGESATNLTRLLTVGTALYVAWGMVFLQLGMIFAMDAALSRWRGKKGETSAGDGDVRTLMRLLATVGVARMALRRVDEQTARALETTLNNRVGMGSGDRSWHNPLARSEFLHPVVDNGTVWVEAGKNVRTRD